MSPRDERQRLIQWQFFAKSDCETANLDEHIIAESVTEHCGRICASKGDGIRRRRAQMASLLRNAPVKLYDLVVQVAIIRPGPIV